MKLTEKFGPFLLALVAPLAYFGLWRALGHAPSSDGLDALTQGVLNLASILVGFLATAKALLFAVPDRGAIRFLKRSGAFGDLADYLFSDIVVWLLTAITSLILVFVGGEIVLDVRRIVTGLWVYLPAAGLLSFWRSMYLFAKFLRVSAKED